MFLIAGISFNLFFINTDAYAITEQNIETDPQYFFEDYPSLGSLPPKGRAEKLREIGDEEAAKKHEEKTNRGLFYDSLYEYTTHAYGFIANEKGSTQNTVIRHAGNIEGDKSLKGKRISILLDKIRVADYPGTGIHNILFDFYAQNYVTNQEKPEHLHFNQVFRGMEGQEVATIGQPIFNGLRVGTMGISFKVMTINVENDTDELILNFFESDTAKAGLGLAVTAQPAIAPLTGLAISVTKSILNKNKNIKVQEVNMGLDFDKFASGARLAKGSYVVVQIPDKLEFNWDWKNWHYDRSSGQIVQTGSSPRTLIPYNYIMFRVVEYE